VTGARPRPWCAGRRSAIFSGVSARRTACLAFGTCLFGLPACGPELPIGERVIDTRVLAVRNEVIAPLTPEAADAAPRCEALPFEGVRVTPWIVTPDGPIDLTGPDFDPVWIACNLGPGEGLFACLKGAQPTALADLPTCPVPSFADLDPDSMSLPDSPSPCVLPADGSDDGSQDFVVPFASTLLLGGDLEITMISRGPGSPDTPACAEPFLAGETEVPNECIYAVQRLSIGPIERLLALAGMFGVELPPELGEAPDPDEIPDGDRNPRILDFSVTRVRDGQPEDLGPQPRGAVVAARPGDTLQIFTTADAADLQEYLVPINGGAGGSEARTEAYDGSWFRTWGALLANGSDDPMSRNEWTMERGPQDETDDPPDGRASLFYVLRDGRQGIDWWWISVALEAE
jgi:hypothetical protein